MSHILNAEGEKLQYILGILSGKSSCACPQDVLTANKSVTTLVEAVTQNQMLLKNKLDRVLEFCPLPPPPPPCKPEPGPCPPPPCKPEPGPCPPPCRPDPCPPPHPAPGPAPRCEKSALQLAGQRERMLWSPDCRLPWRQRYRTGDAVCWEGPAPTQIQLAPGKSYVVQYTLNVCAASPAEGSILLRQTPCGVFTDTLPLRFSAGCQHQTLHHVSVLHPRMTGGSGAELSLVLSAGAPVCVEQAVMDVIELW